MEPLTLFLILFYIAIILSIVSFVGGTVAWTLKRNSDPKRGQKLLTISIVLTIVLLIIAGALWSISVSFKPFPHS